jgi:hypothetical protein
MLAESPHDPQPDDLQEHQRTADEPKPSGQTEKPPSAPEGKGSYSQFG